MLDVDLAAMREVVEGLNYRPLFVTVSGAHLYGFPSSDSDVDLRLPPVAAAGRRGDRRTVADAGT